MSEERRECPGSGSGENDDRPRFLTTRAAALYCGFKTTSALRKAKLEGRIKAAGRRGGRGTWMWNREELDRFLCGVPDGRFTTERSGAPPSIGEAHEAVKRVEVSSEQLGLR